MIAGYHLKGWNKTNNDDGTAITIPYVIESSNINLYAKWEKCSHSINYEYNGGTISSPSVHEYGKITTLIVPTRTGYTFDGWYSSSEFSGDAITTLKDICVRDLTFYAKWEPIQYKILFNAGGGQGSMGQLTMKYGESKTIPPVSFTRTGYDFEGWSLTENGTNVDYRTGDSVSNLTTINNEEITLYSIWTIQKYKVEFIDADGKILKTGTYDYGTSINSTKPSENPSKEGLIFDRWSYDPLPETVTGALTIKAMYKASASPDNTFIFNNGKIIANSNGNSLNVPRSLIGDKEIVMNISVVSIVIPNGSVNTDSGFTVNVTNSNNSLPITISNKLENGYSAFDFNATNDYGSLRAFNSTIKVTIPHIGADANTMVFYLAPDGSIMKMTVISYEPGVSVTFETDHFSTYVATGVDLSIPDPVPPSTSEDDDAYQQWLQQYYQQLAEQQKQQQVLKEQQEQRKVVSVAIAGIAVVMLSIAALMVTRRK